MYTKIIAYFHKYDPNRFSFFYSLKALAALLLALSIAIYFFDLEKRALIFLSLACMFIFLMNNFKNTGLKKLLYLLLFVLIISLFLPMAKLYSQIGVYVVFPSFLWIFLISLAPLISSDLSKIGLFSTLYGFVVLLVEEQYNLNMPHIFQGILIGSICSIFIRFLSFNTYGRYTKHTLLVILDDLIYTCEYLNKDDFKIWRMQAIKHIDEMKLLLKSKIGSIKDPSLIKHQERAIFYLYKCEEISHILISLRAPLRKFKKRELLRRAQKESIYNLEELKKIFNNQKEINLKYEAYDEIMKDEYYESIHPSLKILYQKFSFFAKGGEHKMVLKPSSSFNFKAFLKKLSFENEVFRFAIKLSLAVSLTLLITFLFKLDHGLWISAYMFSIMRIKTSSVKVAGIQNLVGLAIGVIIGIVAIVLFKGSALYIPILLFGFFCSVYFSFFTPTLAIIAISACLCIYFSFISNNYFTLIAVRSIDVLISFIIAMGVSYYIWPSKSEVALKNLFLSLLDDLSKLLKAIAGQDSDYYDLKHKLVEDMESFSNLTQELGKARNNKDFVNMQLLIENINLSLANLEGQIGELKKPELVELLSDVKILNTRFEMLENKANKKPYYFYPNNELKKSLLSKDKKLRANLHYIGLEQYRAYKIVSKNY